MQISLLSLYPIKKERVCSTEDQSNYVYNKHNKNVVIVSECMTILKVSKVENQGNDIMYSKCYVWQCTMHLKFI